MKISRYSFCSVEISGIFGIGIFNVQCVGDCVANFVAFLYNIVKKLSLADSK